MMSKGLVFTQNSAKRGSGFQNSINDLINLSIDKGGSAFRANMNSSVHELVEEGGLIGIKKTGGARRIKSGYVWVRIS